MKVNEIVEFVTRYGGLEYAAGRAVHYAAQAKSDIGTFADSPAKQSLLEFADFVVQREK